MSEAVCVKRGGEKADGSGCRFGGVVPTAEGANHCRGAKPIRPLFPDHWWHNSTVADCAPANTRIKYLFAVSGGGIRLGAELRDCRSGHPPSDIEHQRSEGVTDEINWQHVHERHANDGGNGRESTDRQS